MSKITSLKCQSSLPNSVHKRNQKVVIVKLETGHGTFKTGNVGIIQMDIINEKNKTLFNCTWKEKVKRSSL